MCLSQEPHVSEPIPITIIRPITKPTLELEIIGSSSRLQLTDTILEVQIPQPETQHTNPKPNRGKDPDTLVLVPYEVNGKMFQLNNEEIQAHLDKEEKLEKATREARLSKSELIKEFIKKQKAELNVLNKERLKKLEKAKVLKKKRIDQYKWTISSRLKPETTTDIHIHPNTKPVVITVYRGNDQRNFEVHNSFRFGKKYDRLKVIPGEIRITSSLPALDKLLSKSQAEKGRFKSYVFGDEAFQRMSDIHKVDVDTLLTYLVMASNVNTPANQRFCMVLRSLIDNHPDKEKLKSKRVKLEAVGYSLN
ncbi:hypothetical protein Tco_1138055 [Tanacetum coccineum]